MKHRSPVWLFGILAALVAAGVQPWQRTGFEALLSWDELGYYLYLPAAFIYHDLRDLAFVPDLLRTYQPTGYFYQAIKLDTGSWAMAYTLGLSVLQAPFFALGHAVALLFHYPADGLSAPYQAAMWASGVVYTALGLSALSRFLRVWFSPGIVWAVVGVLLLGTNLLTYSLFNNALTHCYLFALYAGLLLGTQQWHAHGRRRHLLLVLLCLGMMIAIRPTEAVAALIPLLWGLHSGAAQRAKWALVQAQIGWILVFGVLSLLPWMLQMTYWRWATGHWLFNPYAHMGLGFDWLSPHFYEVLFSARKGWLLYTPVAVLLLLGLVLLVTRRAGRPVRWPLLAYWFINFYLISSWSVWWYGGSLGQRALVQSYAPLAFGLGLLLTWAAQHRVRRLVVGAVAVGGILLNLSFTAQYYNLSLLTDGSEPRQYREYLLNPVGDFIPAGQRAAPHVWRAEAIAARVPLVGDSLRPAGTDGLAMGQGGVEYAANQQFEARALQAKHISRLRVGFDVRPGQTDSYTVPGLQAVMEVRTERTHIRKWANAPAYRVLATTPAGQWQHFEQDLALPRTLKPTDTIKLYLWCPGAMSATVRNFRVDGLELK